MNVCFAVIGRDEEARLPAALAQALEAARPEDEVWFVDSGSVDGSAEVARAHGVRVLPAPAGKGRAVAVAVRERGEGWLCLLDADPDYTSTNFAAVLRAEAERDGTDMVVGSFFEPDRRRMVTPLVYRPLVGALFPDRLDDEAMRGMSGYRIVRAERVCGPLPPGYGIETHLNLTIPSSRLVDLGEYRGPLRGYANAFACARDVADAALDCAEREGRLDASGRLRWEEWLRPALDAISRAPGISERELVELAARPVPAQPPATAGRIVTSSPSETPVSSPSRKRMSSPPR